MAEEEKDWPRSSGECLFSGGHLMVPQGTGPPQYCTLCGKGYEEWREDQEWAGGT